jgi:hypothetical protein
MLCAINIAIAPINVETGLNRPTNSWKQSFTARDPGVSLRVMLKGVCSLVGVTLSVVLAAGCGGGSATGASGVSVPASVSGGSGEVVARVGSIPITRTAVSHWITVLAAQDYYRLSHKRTIPVGLVSDPPRYGACVAELETAAGTAPHKVAPLSGVQLLGICRQLYQALRVQAVSLLVEIAMIEGWAAEEGIKVADDEVLQAYRRSMAELFPRQLEVTSYLTNRKTSISDELLATKHSLLTQRLRTKLLAQGSQRAASSLRQAIARWTAETDCRPGYVVEHCSQFPGVPAGSPASPSASVLIEQVAAISTGVCINKAACGNV